MEPQIYIAPGPFELETGHTLPGIMACRLRISAGVKMMSVVMPTTSVRAVMLRSACSSPPRPRPASCVSKASRIA